MSPRIVRLARIVLPLVLVSATLRPAGAAIEAVKGKQYAISQEHGPWMILVADFKDVPEAKFVVEKDGVEKVKNDRYKPGKTAQQAADELVYELRKAGVPAYSFKQKAQIGQMDTLDRTGRFERRVFRAQDDRICVLAGNYPSIEDDVAQKTLTWVKKLEPKCLDEGGVYHKTPGQPGPLAGAFLTVNPLLSADELARRRKTQDPLLLKLNNGFEHDLLDNKGRYTLVVASFYGKSLTTNAGDADRSFKVGSSLDDAAMDAWQMTKFLRSKKIEAYVWHDRYTSIVTVGAFDSADDPRIAPLVKFFGAKQVTDPDSGQTSVKYEYLDVPGPTPEAPPAKRWTLDPQPRVIEVPKL